MENKSPKPWWQPALVVFGEVVGWVAAPIIAALFLGRYLDEKYGTEPWYYLGLTGVAFIISSIGIGITATKYIKQIEKDTKKNESRDRNKRSGPTDNS